MAAPSWPRAIALSPRARCCSAKATARNHVYRVETGAICLFKVRADGSRTCSSSPFPATSSASATSTTMCPAPRPRWKRSLSCLPRSALEPDAGALPEYANRASRRPSSARWRSSRRRRARRPRPDAAGAHRRAVRDAFPLQRLRGPRPRVLTDSLSCGVVAGYLNMSVDDLAHWLTGLEALGLVEAVPERPAAQEPRRVWRARRRGGLSATYAL